MNAPGGERPPGMSGRRRTTSYGRRQDGLRFPPGRTQRGTSDCAPRPALGPPPKRGSFPRGSRTPVLTGTQAGLSAVFGMGTGVTPPLWPPERRPVDSNHVAHRAVGDTMIGCTCTPVNAWIRSTERSRLMNVGFDRLVLAGSTPRCLGAYTPSLSNSSSTSGLRRRLFSRWVSGLDAFSPYPVMRSCPALALSDNRYTSGIHQ